jgi:hypothetical protein
MSSQLTPHGHMLQPYMSPNTAQISRIWIGLILTSGIVPMLPPQAANQTPIARSAASSQFQIIAWGNEPTTNI